MPILSCVIQTLILHWCCIIQCSPGTEPGLTVSFLIFRFILHYLSIQFNVIFKTRLILMQKIYLHSSACFWGMRNYFINGNY